MTLNYGSFIQTIICFVIVAFSIFLMVRLLGRLKRKETAEAASLPPAPSPEEQLLTEIRDLLRDASDAPGNKPIE